MCVRHNLPNNRARDPEAYPTSCHSSAYRVYRLRLGRWGILTSTHALIGIELDKGGCLSIATQVFPIFPTLFAISFFGSPKGSPGVPGVRQGPQYLDGKGVCGRKQSWLRLYPFFSFWLRLFLQLLALFLFTSMSDLPH